MKKNLLVLISLVVLISDGFLEAEKLEGEGESVAKLAKGWKTKSADDFKGILKDSNDDIAAAGFGMYLRMMKDPATEDGIESIVTFAKRPGMFNRTAFILSCNRALKGKSKMKKLVDSLAASKDATAQKLAAAVLVNLYSLSYVSSSETYPCARNDLKDFVSENFNEDVDDPIAKKKAANKKRNQKKQFASIPAIPDVLFSANKSDIVELAMIAAAFSGDSSYKEKMMSVSSPSATQSGAILFYLSRQGEELSDNIVGKTFTTAMKSAYSFSRNGDSHLVNPMFSGGSLACMGVANLKDPKYLVLINQAFNNKDMRVQIDAVRAIRKIAPDEKSLVAMNNMLKTADWPVLVELCASIGANADKRLIPGLIERLQKEEGRFRLDLVYALSSIAGEQMGKDADEWNKWWLANKTTFNVDTEKTKQYRKTTRVQDVAIIPNGFFYGVQIFSDHFVYVVDTSASMKGTRMESLRANFVESLNSLAPKGRSVSSRDKIYYNIVDFGGDVITLDSSGLITNLKEGIKRVETMPMTLGTRSYDAMERGWSIEGTDSIYFLSDGAPVWGQLEAWTMIDAALDILFLYKPIAISMVAFDPNSTGEKAMKLMANDNFGSYDAPL